MLQAWITAPAGSLYFAAPATAYNLETLRRHARALRGERRACREAEAPEGVLQLSLGCILEDGLAAKVAALVDDLSRAGIRVCMLAGDPAASGVGGGAAESGGADGRDRERYPAASVAALAALTSITSWPQRRRGAAARRRYRSLDTAAPRGATSDSRG